MLFSSVINTDDAGEEKSEQTQILWTTNEVAPTTMTFGEGHAAQENDSQITATIRVLNHCLRPFGKSVITPDEREFASAIPQSHRKGEKAYHVKAHRGSKDGARLCLLLHRM